MPTSIVFGDEDEPEAPFVDPLLPQALMLSAATVAAAPA
jgi:multisubunit Na+/H+ antiporter MnhC subunit